MSPGTKSIPYGWLPPGLPPSWPRSPNNGPAMPASNLDAGIIGEQLFQQSVRDETAGVSNSTRANRTNPHAYCNGFQHVAKPAASTEHRSPGADRATRLRDPCERHDDQAHSGPALSDVLATAWPPLPTMPRGRSQPDMDQLSSTTLEGQFRDRSRSRHSSRSPLQHPSGRPSTRSQDSYRRTGGRSATQVTRTRLPNVIATRSDYSL
jgi:hypothetical protein